MTDIDPELERLLREETELAESQRRPRTMTLTPPPTPAPAPANPEAMNRVAGRAGRPRQPSVQERMIEEQNMSSLPDDAPKVTRIRFALLHGADFTAAEVAERFQVSPPTLSMVVADLERAGFTIERTKQDDRQVRMMIADLNHIPQPFVSRAPKAPSTRKAGRPRGQAPIRPGIMADVAQKLLDAYPDEVKLGTKKPQTQAVYRLRTQRHWQIERGEGLSAGTYRLAEMPTDTGIDTTKPKPTTKTKPGMVTGGKKKKAAPTKPIPELDVAPPSSGGTEPLLVDDIFETVAPMLFPNGHVPMQALPALIAWRDQTAEMLATVAMLDRIHQ